LWLREVITIEEREDAPPESELNALDKLTRELAARTPPPARAKRKKAPVQLVAGKPR
jgi:hypothetical protein